MFEFVLLIICSIFLARYLEKRSKIISTAHAILFIVLMVFYFFTSEHPLIATAAHNVLGDNYKFIHEAFVESAHYSRAGFSTLFIVEIVINLTISVVGVIGAIKAFKLIVKEEKLYDYFNATTNHAVEYVTYPHKTDIKCSNRTYLLNCCFRN